MLRKMAHDLRLSQSDVVRLALYRLYDPFQKGQVKPTDRDVEMLRVG